MACNNSTRRFVDGTYTRHSEHAFGKEDDTLVISGNNKRYIIERKWKYERVLDGKALEPEYKQESSTASYSEKHRTLVSQEGDVYTFDLKEGLLLNGPTKYKKL